MTHEMESAIKLACAKAICALGKNYKGLSCFLYNWKQTAKNPCCPRVGGGLPTREDGPPPPLLLTRR